MKSVILKYSNVQQVLDFEIRYITNPCLVVYEFLKTGSLPCMHSFKCGMGSSKQYMHYCYRHSLVNPSTQGYSMIQTNCQTVLHLMTLVDSYRYLICIIGHQVRKYLLPQNCIFICIRYFISKYDSFCVSYYLFSYLKITL